MDDRQRREFHEALLEASALSQAAILKAKPHGRSSVSSMATSGSLACQCRRLKFSALA
jgi:hypothetical protein